MTAAVASNRSDSVQYLFYFPCSVGRHTLRETNR